MKECYFSELVLSAIFHAIRQSRTIFQRVCNYSIYACAVTIRIVCFSILTFVYQYDFPPFMVLIIALLNDETIMSLSVDRVLPSIIALRIVGIWRKSSPLPSSSSSLRRSSSKTRLASNGHGTNKDRNDPIIHMIIYLQVAIISQVLIFVTRSHGFFMERPSYALLIAAFGNWPFTQISGISGGWIGSVWIWNLIWFLPLDGVKFAMKATIIKYLRQRYGQQLQREVKSQSQGVPIARTTSRVGSIHESLYGNHVSFIKRAARSIGFKDGKKVQMRRGELKCFAYPGCTLLDRGSPVTLPARNRWRM